MQEKTCKTVRFYCGLAISAMTAVVAALFIWQTLDIYLNGGNRPFSSEIVAERLTLISPAFWVWVAMIVAGFVVWEVFPVQPHFSPLKDDCYALKRLKKRVPPTVGDEELSSLNYIKRGEKLLLIIRICAAALCAAGAIYSIVYLALPGHFPKTDVTAEMLQMVKNVLPCAFIALLILCAVKFVEARIAKLQIPHMKKLAVSKNGGDYKTAGECAVCGAYSKFKTLLNNKYFVLGLRIAVGCLAVSFIIAGALNGNMRAIFIKAINICTECIGLG